MIAARQTWGAPATDDPTTSGWWRPAVRGTGGRPLLLLLYRALLIMDLVSVPIGTALSWARH